MSDSPRYVIHRCQHCGGKIEFDANELTTENNIVSCPHCGVETELHVSHKERTSDEDASTPDKHKRVKVTKGARTSLTPTQCASPVGQELVNLLCEITRDGLVAEEGVRRLNVWLDGKTDSDIPAIKYLSQLPERIGKITTAKAFDIHFAMERVLPKSVRGEVKARRQEAWLHSPLKPKATEAQLDYIRGLGGTPPPGINIAEASLLIGQLLGESDSQPSEEKATQSQIQYIRDLGGNPPIGVTKLQASMLIEQLLRSGQGQPTRRQMAVPTQLATRASKGAGCMAFLSAILFVVVICVFLLTR